MGEASGLVPSTNESAQAQSHQLRVISKFAPSTLQSYFRIWKRWFDFASNLDASPFQPATVLLADFLAEHAHGPLQVATAYYKGLSWMARHAQLPDLMDALQSPVCKAYLQSSTISEKRESAPLPLSFVIYLESMVLAKTTAPGDVLQLGSILFMIWSSLRWSDALWISPDTLTIQQHAMFAIASHTKTTNRGMPVACFVFGLLGHHGATAWAQLWLNVVHQALHDTRTLYPKFHVDFLLTEIGTDINKPLFMQPLHQDPGLHLLRYRLCKCDESHGVPAKPEDFHLLGTHSCKTTLLCWAQKLQLPLEQRQLQGHHRSSVNGSVALYSRNDTLPALMLQRHIAQRVAEGFRPLRPMLRGGAPALPDFAVQVPPWRPLPFLQESPKVMDDPATEAAPKAIEADGASEASEDSEASGDDLEAPDVPDEMFFLINPVSNVAHIACPCKPTDRSMCYEDAQLQAFRTACGARPNAISGDLIFAVSLPSGARLCLRNACARSLSKSA